MKKLIGMLLTVFATSSAMALSIDVVDCKAAGNAYALNLVRVNDTLVGQLRDAYNTAEVHCEPGAWGPMTYTKPDITCIGTWAQAFDMYGKSVERHVEIELSMENSNLKFVGRAKYEKNWDERNAAYNTYVGFLFPKRTLTCQLDF
ncbi:MAG: hypothetical protein J7501_10805 [Bdellovibrio sp.]|nr:hypothetical protein [Bdellovibrio sp.]